MDMNNPNNLLKTVADIAKQNGFTFLIALFFMVTVYRYADVMIERERQNLKPRNYELKGTLTNQKTGETFHIDLELRQKGIYE